MSSSSAKITTICVGAAAGGLVVLAYGLTKYIYKAKEKKRFQQKCKEWPKDFVIVHAVRRGKLAPHVSPFVLKLETFLRMHRIPYIFDSEFPFSYDNGKMPWITVNGENYSDSQLIIDFLSEKYGVKTVQDKALEGTATMARIMMDEHFFWGMVLYRYVYSNGQDLDKIFNMPPSLLKWFRKYIHSRYKSLADSQGAGLHSEKDVTKMMKADLRALSSVLGDKLFLIGDEPCSDDCAVFGQLAMLIWNDLSSPYTKLIEEELPNLKDYCIRMRERYWKDWDDVIKAGL